MVGSRAPFLCMAASYSAIVSVTILEGLLKKRRHLSVRR